MFNGTAEVWDESVTTLRTFSGFFGWMWFVYRLYRHASFSWQFFGQQWLSWGVHYTTNCLRMHVIGISSVTLVGCLIMARAVTGFCNLISGWNWAKKHHFCVCTVIILLFKGGMFMLDWRKVGKGGKYPGCHNSDVWMTPEYMREIRLQSHNVKEKNRLSVDGWFFAVTENDTRLAYGSCKIKMWGHKTSIHSNKTP